MANRNRLIESWQKRLKLGFQLTRNASPRLRSIGRVYVRVYRFLLAIYSTAFLGGASEPPLPDSKVVPPTSGESIIPPREELQGTPAKPIERMRSTLDRIHSANETSHASDLSSAPKQQGGLGRHDWITVATESRQISIEKCLDIFGEHHIPARTTIRGRQRIVEVLYRHRDQAIALIRESPQLFRPEPVTDVEKLRLILRQEQRVTLYVVRFVAFVAIFVTAFISTRLLVSLFTNDNH